MISDPLVVAVLAAAPSVIVGAVGYFLKRLISDVGRSIEQLGSELRSVRDSLGLVHTDTAVLRTRIEVLEGEVKQLRADKHDLANRVQALSFRRAGND